ncbi:hypothetical protein [Nonomuraea sp. NPDC002799]
MRGFTGMPARRAALERFYGGPVWQAHRDAANATLLDSDDVLLPRSVGAGGGASDGEARLTAAPERLRLRPTARSAMR